MSERARDLAWLWACALALGLGALALFARGVGQPAAPYFDEVHYVPAARALRALSGGVNVEHPLFAKMLIAGSMAVLGDNPLGWRMPGVVFGAGGVLALFWLGVMLFEDWRCAVCAAVLLVVNQTWFVQARIAMLDMPMMACLLAGAACLLHGCRSGVRRWDYAGAVLLGLSVGAKWVAAPYVGLFLLAWGWQRRRGGVRVLAQVAALAGVAGAVYLATFWPAFFYRHGAMTWRHLIGFQFEMAARQRMVLPAHPYQSPWWQWPVMARPMWYAFDQSGGVYRAVLLVGNPVIYWGGLGFVALSGWMARRDGVLWACVGLWAFSLGMWVVIPKAIGFFYYYNLSGVWLCRVCVGALRGVDRGRLRWLFGFTAVSAAMFGYFYPVLAGVALPPDDSWTRWMWFRAWM